MKTKLPSYETQIKALKKELKQTEKETFALRSTKEYEEALFNRV